MTAFRPITAHHAVELVEEAGVPDARAVIVDRAAVGLLKAYAEVIETVGQGGTTAVRGSAVPLDLCKRLVDEGATADIWTGRTVRLPKSEATGAPAVNINGFGFSPGDLQRLIDQHLERRLHPAQIKAVVAASPEPVKVVVTPPKSVEVEATTSVVAAKRLRRSPDASALRPGALLATIAETQAALGLGRTKVNELMRRRMLERVEIDGGVRITVASIRALAGMN